MTDRPPHFRFWPKGVARQLRVPRATLLDYLDTTARRYPDKPAIVYCGALVTYAQLRGRVDALAGYLQQRLGVEPGDRVLLASQNCPQFVTAFYAVLRAGGVVVPVNPMSKAAEVRHYALDSGARVACVAQDLLPALTLGEGEGDGELRGVLVHAYADAVDTSASDDVLPDWVTAPRAPLDDARLHGFEHAIALDLAPAELPLSPDDLAVLPYTSGTTGHPKGCMHTHATMLASLASSAVWKQLHVETVTLAVAPLFHMLGLQNGMNMPMFLGATAVMMPRWDPAMAVRLIERHAVTAWSAPPAMVIDLFSHPDAERRDLSSLALLSGGGAAMPEAVAAMLLQRHGLSYNEGYGLTETASFLHANPPARGKRQCLGMPTQGVDSRIVDPVTFEELPPGETGELVTRGAQVMKGYWRNPEADREAFIEIGGQRFFRTGDLALMDEEGYFFLRDRLKRMINASGYKVWPTEVENAMYEHPAIHEACVIAVPDGKRGESVKALVVLKPAQRGQVREEEIVAWCRERMAVYKAPRVVEFLDRLPKSGTGKILWRELQEAHRAATPQEPT
ncbi:long-chain fatty acid--CoA ligase [Variovorax sp. Root318D1]|uniref:long-chain-fatty-acid--CoA ligase n=1 Tax=Variovorax sp. Root318D1 TaxID=1736513 RepID=UPI0006F7F20B|nr:long-chain-fatty-acid--CoA ligase [Variovorax sp. Root318D1]KQU89756.1 long-chain fatty acid--CoA ligase [Variovorax sp. Root318D1]